MALICLNHGRVGTWMIILFSDSLSSHWFSACSHGCLNCMEMWNKCIENVSEYTDSANMSSKTVYRRKRMRLLVDFPSRGGCITNNCRMWISNLVHDSMATLLYQVKESRLTNIQKRHGKKIRQFFHGKFDQLY